MGPAQQLLRQPRGPPTDVDATNFASRISLKARREAMARICAATPRMASISTRAVASSAA